MDVKELVKNEEEQSHRIFLANFIADMIYIHFKHFKNEKFETYEQMYNSSMQVIHYDNEVQDEIYKHVDSILEEKYDLFFAHNDKYAPIYLVDISGKENEV